MQEEGELGVTANRHRVSSQGDRNALELDNSDGCTTLRIHGKPSNCMVNFMLLEFYLSKKIAN